MRIRRCCKNKELGFRDPVDNVIGQSSALAEWGRILRLRCQGVQLLCYTDNGSSLNALQEVQNILHFCESADFLL